MVTVGDEKQGPGQLVVAGQQELVQAVGKMWVACLNSQTWPPDQN